MSIKTFELIFLALGKKGGGAVNYINVEVHYLHPMVWITTVKLDTTTEQGLINLHYSSQCPVAQIGVKILFKYLAYKEAQLIAVMVYENPENSEHWAKLFLSRYDFMKSIMS